MKKSCIRLFSVMMVVCMLVGMLTPFTVFADEPARDFVFRETFSSGSVNTSGDGVDIVAAKGYFLGDSSNCTYTLENDSLKFTSRTGNGPYTDLRFNAAETTKDLTQDFILSFWIKPDTNNITIKKTGWAWYDTNDGGSAAAEKNIFYISDGNIVLNEVSYPDAHLNKDVWSLIEIVFNYDENATSNSGKQGATVSYTVLFNGEKVATAAAPIKHNNINYFRFLRYADATYEMDDLTIALGNKSLIDIPRTAPAEEEPDTPDAPVVCDYIYREEFGKGFINTRNMQSAIAGAYGFWLKAENGTTYDLDGGALNFTNKKNGDFIDLRYYIDGNTKDMAMDLTLSFWINPSVANFGATMAFGDKNVGKSGDKDGDLVKISGGKLYVDNADSGKAVPANQWTFIEVLCDYDATATSSDGKSGAFTSYTVKMNGATVGTVSAHEGKVYHEINDYRLFNGSTQAFSIDDLTISVGHASLYGLGRSAAPTPVKGEVVFSEDFSDDINTSSSASDIVAANGLYASHTNGTTYNVDGGTLNYVDNKYRDNIRLEFWHEGAKIDLSQDFVLSYKIKSTYNTTYRMYWTDSRNGNDEHSFRHWSNRIRICDELKTGGITNPDVFTKPGEWDLIELFFHYDENAVAETGEKGAFTFYSVYVNGEYVQSTKTFYDFHRIDEFTLFMLSEDSFSIDDLTIAYGNVSLGGDEFDDGWDKKEYFLDATVTADYDYSLCIVGDTQVLSAFKKGSYKAIYDWIIDNYESKKMLAVLGLGDVTSNDTEEEWVTASEAISLLQNVIPFTVIRGNHDGDEMLNTYFNNAAYKSQFGGFYDDNNVNTFWMPLTAGNDKYIVIGLDYGPTHDELAWAESIISANPDYKIIITTHSYMDGNGVVLDDSSFGTNTEENTNSGEEIWDKLGRKYANIQMILCGHMEGDYIAVRQDVGDNGNVVTQMMINPQWIDDALTAGAGNVTMFYFNEGSDTIIVETYSTVEKKHFMAENQFTLDLDPDTDNGEEGGNGAGSDNDEPAEKLPEVIYRNDFDEALNTTNNADSINAANGMWNKFELGTEYTLNGGAFNYITRNGDKYFELRYYYDGNYKDLKQDFIVSFWVKPTSADATFRIDLLQSSATSNTKTFAVVKNKLRINNVIYNDTALSMNVWSLIEIVAHYDAAKGGTYAYTVMLNGEVVDTVDALVVYEEINDFVFFRNASDTFSIDNLMIATGSQSLMNTLNPSPVKPSCEHSYDNACDTTCNNCGEERSVEGHSFTVTDKNDTHHWKKCSVCGTPDGNQIAHVFDNACDTDCSCGYTRTVTHDYSITDKNDTQHWNKCSVCGTVNEETKVNHQFDNACDTDCACGYTRSITHSFTVDDYNNEKHWKKCSVCGTPDGNQIAHVFDNACDANCACGYVREIEHTYDGECDTKCNVCNEPRTANTAHVYVNGCDKICNVCGETRTTAHTYSNGCDAACNNCYAPRVPDEHIGGKATCTKKAVCTVCGVEYGEYGDHVFGTKWVYGSVCHWHECSCGSKKDEVDHTFGDWTEKDGNRTRACECGYTVIDLNYKSEESLSTGAIAAICVAYVATVGVVGFGTYFFVFRKKKIV